MATNYQGGNDVVLNFQPLMNTMARNLQYQQQQALEQRKQKEAVMSQATKDLSKINSNGLWKADLPQFNERMNKVKETYFQMSKLKAGDSDKFRELSMDLQTQLQGIDSFVYSSKKVNEDYGRAMNTVKDLVGKGKVMEYKNHLSGLVDKPSSEITREVLDSSPYVDKWDYNKMVGSIQKRAKSGLDGVVPQSEIIGSYSTSGGKKYDTIQQRKEVGSVKSFEILSDLARSDRNVKAYVEDLMTTQGLDFNGAINALQEEFGDVFVEVSTKDVSADKPAPRTTVVNVNMPSEAVASNYYPISLGNFTSNESKTYREDVPLIGKRDVYTANGQKATVDFKDISFKGQALMRLPVDNNGNPLPTNRDGQARDASKVAGYREFVAGTLPQEKAQDYYSMLDSKTQSLFRDQALLPMSQIQWIGQSKGKRGDLQGIQNQSKNTPVQSTSNKPKFN